MRHHHKRVAVGLFGLLLPMLAIAIGLTLSTGETTQAQQVFGVGMLGPILGMTGSCPAIATGSSRADVVQTALTEIETCLANAQAKCSAESGTFEPAPIPTLDEANTSMTSYCGWFSWMMGNCSAQGSYSYKCKAYVCACDVESLGQDGNWYVLRQSEPVPGMWTDEAAARAACKAYEGKDAGLPIGTDLLGKPSVGPTAVGIAPIRYGTCGIGTRP